LWPVVSFLFPFILFAFFIFLCFIATLLVDGYVYLVEFGTQGVLHNLIDIIHDIN